MKFFIEEKLTRESYCGCNFVKYIPRNDLGEFDSEKDAESVAKRELKA